MSIILLLSLLSIAFGRIEIANRELPHVEDEYIITYYASTTHEQAAQHWALMESFGVTLDFKYSAGAHTGFAAKITDQKLLEALQEDPLVEHIEVNGFAYATQVCDGVQAETPSWGLSRTSHEGTVTGGLTGRFEYQKSEDGTGVSVYVIDTGVLTTHVDFAGRASFGYSSIPNENTDGNGHGTHCAGTVAGALHGIAKNARIVAVKVLSNAGSGTWAQVVSGVNWVTNNGVKPAVASMSLGGTGSQASLTAAIDALVASGITVVVAAGNNGADACGFTPANIGSVISVGATEIIGTTVESDARASFSNHGRCTHIYAPGRNIRSTWINTATSPPNQATNTISGTSMACPHVAGVVAGLLTREPLLTPALVKQRIQTNSQKGLIGNLADPSPNYLLYNLCEV